MKTILPILAASALSAAFVRAQFPNYPPADRVLGAPDIDERGNGAFLPSRMGYPTGLAIDPTTRKVFVAATDQNRILRFASIGDLVNGANAEAVLGQINFSAISSATTQTGLYQPYGLHVDATGRLWVADSFNNRVLLFLGASTLSNAAAADRVYGQPNFTTNTNDATLSKMNTPLAVHVDGNDNLWVADSGNHRVLRFSGISNMGNGAAATSVLGQTDFISGSAGTTDAKFDTPAGVTLDALGRLWVADRENHRVLRFDNAATLANGSPASGVLGQPDFVSAGPGLSARAMKVPAGLVTDAVGTLWVVETDNSRVLSFRNAATKTNGAAADGVIGQADFVSVNTSVSNRSLSLPVGGIALDPDGGLWIADSDHNRVLRFSPDRTPPSVLITSKVPKSTAKSRLTIRGTATDANRVVAVRYRLGGGAFKTAAGTNAWSFGAALKPGRNQIQIVAEDELGNVSPARSLRVMRD